MWDASVPPGQHPVRWQSAKFKYRNTHCKNSEKDTTILNRFKDELLVNPTTVSDFKNALRRKHTLQLFEIIAQQTNHYKQ
jgi:hypothetical protein